MRRLAVKFSFSSLTVTAMGVLALCSVELYAMPAMPGAITATQPDGSKIQVRLRGDEHGHWYESESGHTIMRNAAKQWVYARPAKEHRAVSTRSIDARPNGANGIMPGVAVVGVDKAPAEAMHLHPVITSPFGAHGHRHDHKPISIADVTRAHQSRKVGNPIKPFSGELALLMLRVYYDDAINSSNCRQCAQTSLSYSQDALFGESASVKDYYENVSQGAVQISVAQEHHGQVNDGVIGWLRLGERTPGALDDGLGAKVSNQIAADAIYAAMPYIDFGQYDHNNDGTVESDELTIIIVVAGYEGSFGEDEKGLVLSEDEETPRLWAHAWSFYTGSSGVRAPIQDSDSGRVRINTTGGGASYTMMAERHGDHPFTIGTIVHEMGHQVFVLPDLYDTSDESAGVGVWSVMSYGSWGADRHDAYPGTRPVLPDAWTRNTLGWIEAQTATPGAVESATAASLSGASAIRIDTSNEHEYFLIENRAYDGYDRGFYRLIGSNRFNGLAVWHVDDTVGRPRANNDNANREHRRVDLVAASGDELIDDFTSYGRANNLFSADTTDFLDVRHDEKGSHPYAVGFSEVSSSDIVMFFNVTNYPPDFELPGMQFARAGSDLEFEVDVYDLNGDKPVVSVENLPEQASFDEASGVFSWSHVPADTEAKITFVAIDQHDPNVRTSHSVTVSTKAARDPVSGEPLPSPVSSGGGGGLNLLFIVLLAILQRLRIRK